MSKTEEILVINSILFPHPSRSPILLHTPITMPCSPFLLPLPSSTTPMLPPPPHNVDTVHVSKFVFSHTFIVREWERGREKFLKLKTRNIYHEYCFWYDVVKQWRFISLSLFSSPYISLPLPLCLSSTPYCLKPAQSLFLLSL